MITILRERIFKSSWYKYAIWALIIILFLVFTLPNLLDKSSGSARGSWVVQVNGEKIDYQDFARKVLDIETQIATIRQQHSKYADLLLQRMGLNYDPRMVAMEMLVREALINQAAYKLKAQIGEAFVIEKLNNMQFVQQELADLIPPYVIQENGINEGLLRRYLQQMKISQEQFDSKIHDVLMRGLLSECAMLGFYMPAFEAYNKYAIDFTKKRFSALTFSYDNFLKKARQNSVSPEKLKGFFDEQVKLGSYVIPEQRDALMYTFDPLKYGIAVTDQEIEALYQQRKGQDFVQTPATVEIRRILFVIPSEQEAQEIFKKAKTVHTQLLANPSSFADKAKELSQDEATANKGGLMPAFGKGSQESVLDKSAFLLKNDGDISDVIKTSKGFEIIQRVSKSPAVFKPLKTVYNELKEQLLNERFVEQFAQDVRALLAGKEVSIKDIDTFAAQHAGARQEKKDIQQDNQKLSQVLYGLRNAEVTFYLDNNKGVMLKLTKIEPQHVQDFDKIRGQVEEDFYAQEANNLLQNMIKEVQQALSQKGAQEVAKDFGIAVIQTDFLKKNDIGKLAEMRTKGLPVDAMFQIENVGATVVLDRDKNFYLVRLDEAQDLDPAGFDEQKKAIFAELEPERRKFFGESYIASLYRTATIKPNESLFNESLPNT